MSKVAALCCLLFAACCVDYRKRKIPNLLIAAMVLFGALWRFGQEGAGGIAFFLLQAMAVMCVFGFLFRLGTLGAGDVKLLGVTAGYLPVNKILLFLFVSLLIAAMISMVKLWKKHMFWERLYYLTKYLADVWASGQWRFYFAEGTGSADIGICLSGPILFSLILYLGGVY